MAAVAGAAPGSAAGSVLAGAAALLLALAVFVGGGSDTSRLVPLGALALLVAAAGVAAAASGFLARARVGRVGAALVALLGAWVVWTGVSILWSIQPDRSWDAFNRGAVYLALLVVGILVGALVERAPRAVAYAFAVPIGLALAWALLGKVVPALGPDSDRNARLRAPIGYWNALALLAAMSLPLWLWLAAQRTQHALVRAGATAALAAAFVAIALTASRGGFVVAFVAVAAWFALAGPRLEGALALFVALPVAGALAAWALSRPGIADAGVGADERTAAGLLFGVLIVVGLGLAFAAAHVLARADARRPLDAPARARVGHGASIAAAAAILILLVGAAVRVGDPAAWVEERWDEFRNPPNVQVPQGPERFGSFSSNNRWTWWTQAWAIFEQNPLRGTGAGTFELARRPLRDDTQQPLAPHNLALQALAETGVVGFALLLATAIAAALAVAAALRRLRGADRAAAAALAAALVAYLAHALIDIGWDYVAVSAPFFLALGVLVSAGRGAVERPRRQPLAALAAAALAVVVISSLATPRSRSAGSTRRSTPSRAATSAAPPTTRAARAVARPALDRAAPPASRRAGGAGRRARGVPAVRRGGGAPAEEPGDVVPARPLRVRGPRRPRPRVPLPRPRLRARPPGRRHRTDARPRPRGHGEARERLVPLLATQPAHERGDADAREPRCECPEREEGA